MFKLIRDIRQYRELLLVLIQRNIRIRYKGTVLGFCWSLLGPIFLILIYAVFLGIMRFNVSIPILVTGILVWQFLAMSLGDSLYVILGNANLVKKTSFPRIILPLSMVVANLVNFLLSMVVLFAYLLIVRADFGQVAWLPLIVLTQCALCIAVSLIVSAANVFFRDTEHSMQVITLAWFFLTPIIYPLSYPLSVMKERFPEILQSVYFLNPMAGIVGAYRMALLSVDPVKPAHLAISLAVAWILFAVSIPVFQKAQGRFADEM